MARIRRQQADSVERIERQQDARLHEDLAEAEDGDGDEPERHDRAEESADMGGAPALHHEETHQQRDGDGDHVGIEERRRDLQPLDRAQHRDRRRDDAVAEEQGRAHQPGGQDQLVPAAALALAAQRQGGQRESAALAPVVGAHDDDDVFEGDDDGQRPGDQRERAEDAGLGHLAGTLEALLHGVEGRGPDIAVNDAERAQNEGLPRLPSGLHAVMRRREGHVPPIEVLQAPSLVRFRPTCNAGCKAQPE